MARLSLRSQQSGNQPLALPPTQRFLPVLLLLFVGSGCAALIYEIVWFQLLELVDRLVGGVARRAARHVHGRHVPRQPAAAAVRVAGAASAARLRGARAGASASLGLLVLVVGAARRAASTRRRPAHGLAGILLRAASSARVCLLPPTLLMGATLPAIARWVETTPTGVSWLGFFYGGNIAGAVFGCLLAGFYLLRVYDMADGDVRRRRRSTSASRRLGLALSRRAPHRPAIPPPPPVEAERRRGAAITRSTSRSRCRDSPRSAPKWCGRDCCR